ncbi:MAG: ABC transporter permease, partial [Rhodospirillales bacterium]|nr:ABC transporter permease [Rhodospirillales bacterium]
MVGFLIQRLLQAAVVMLIISALVFTGVFAIGNPIDVLISPDATQQIRLDTIKRYGLDLPLWEQYWNFLVRLVQGNFGRSFVFNMPVLDLILSRLPATLELTLAAVIGATLIGVPLGMYAGYKPESPISKLAMGLSVLGFSVPTFWIGLVLILTFAVNLGWLPAGGRGDTVSVFGIEWSFLTLNGLSHLFLPALNLSLFKLAMMMRLARAGTREVMLSDTVKFARAAGESEGTILLRHVLRLISIPIVTVFGLEFGSTLAFAVVTETIFSWPGIGKLII